MRRSAIWLVGWVFCTALLSAVRAEDWPGWRGPRGDGTSLEKNVPIDWNGTENRNIAWKTEIPGKGHASPIVSGDRIFVVSCLDDRQERILVCLDRASGKILWQQVVVVAPLEGKHNLNSFASSTPAADEERVYVSFLDRAEMVVAAYDFAGQQKWLVRPGPFASKHGYCAPLVLFEKMVIVNGDHDGDGFLVALDRETGKTVWKKPRPNNTRSYCPPLIRKIDDRTQMVLSGSKCVASYDPRSGEQHWIIDGPTEQYVASMVYNGDMFFLTAGFPEFHILAIRPDGRGNVSDTHIAWRTTKGAAYVPSPIIGGGGKYFLIVSDGGIASCFESATGKRFWMERIGPHYSASAVEADGLVHFLSDRGVTTVIRPGEQFDVVAQNELGEDCYASPAISHRQIFLRGEKNLYCVGKKAE